MKRIYLKLLICLFLIMIFCNSFASPTTFASVDKQKIDISSVPHKILFDASNLKPGDWIIEKVLISNEGMMDFRYSANVQKTSGSDLFFQQLQLEASINDTLLYNGPLHEFTGMPARPLKHATSEEMTLKVTFPWESGNEFQGLSADATIQFIAEEDIETTPTEEIDKEGVTSEDRGKPTLSILESSLPQTGETPPTLYYLIGGFLLMTGLGFYTTTVMRKRRE